MVDGPLGFRWWLEMGQRSGGRLLRWSDKEMCWAGDGAVYPRACHSVYSTTAVVYGVVLPLLGGFEGFRVVLLYM